VQPAHWRAPRGYSNAVAANGTLVFLAGQIGWNEEQHLVCEDFAGQTEQALRNVVTVLQAAGGAPGDIVRMTWYVTNRAEYLSARQTIGQAYRRIIGGFYPAMTLVEVAALLEDGAKIEIEATAVIPP
jgi:enamine deaminase RidA (YjgF/YER057c/UK114 family)